MNYTESKAFAFRTKSDDYNKKLKAEKYVRIMEFFGNILGEAESVSELGGRKHVFNAYFNSENEAEYLIELLEREHFVVKPRLDKSLDDGFIYEIIIEW